MNGNPLGKYTEVVTAGISVFVIVAAVVMHGIENVVGVDFDTAFVDGIALIAVGVLFGGRAVANGAKQAIQEPFHQAIQIAESAHRRLDGIQAPPADGGADQ